MKIDDLDKVYNILREYDGENSYMIDLKNKVMAYKTKLNNFEAEFVLMNKDTEPRFINKIVKVADWYGTALQEQFGTEFVPKVLQIGWYMGQNSTHYFFYCRYRKSIEKAVFLIAPKIGILTDFLAEDFKLLDIDFTPYEERSRRTVYEHQKEAVKFLVSRKKAILSLGMGLGKTMSAILAALVGKYEHVLIISPSSVKKSWEDELKCFVDESDITIVQGSNWRDAKFTIINYDILDNFYTVPTQTVVNKELDVDDKGNVVNVYKKKEIVSRSKKVIDAAMSDSQLFKAKYDLIIIDEAHRLSNSSSGRYKIIADLVKRSSPKGIFEVTGTIITNSSKNLYNLLKIIDVPITRNWEAFMKRYCGAKIYFKKNERNAYTAMFCKKVNKPNYGSLSESEREMLNEMLQKRCKKICIPGEDTNMDELQEIIKPYYLRRTKEELPNMVPKTIKYLYYDMTDSERQSYDAVWDEYLESCEDKEKAEKYRKLEEVSVLRQWLANKMIPKTVSLARKCIDLGHKVIIFCAYDNEVNSFRGEFGDECVYHNGKVTEKKKNEAVEKFQNDDSVKVFIGNIQSAGVGLTLTSGDVVIFNNFSFVPAECLQCEDRIHRLNQTKPCTVYYQSFKGTYFDKMLEIVHGKQTNIDKIIVTENEK